jgi:hypothetical protein
MEKYKREKILKFSHISETLRIQVPLLTRLQKPARLKRVNYRWKSAKTASAGSLKYFASANPERALVSKRLHLLN